MARLKMDARFFDDSATDPREYPADKFAEYFRSFIKDGVFKDLERFKTIPGEGMQIVTAPGIGWVQGYWCKNPEPATFDVPPAHGTLTRVDMLVMQLDRTDAQGVFLEYKAGEPGNPALPPVLEHTANIWEVALYRITVPAGLTEITAANIKDERVEATSFPQEDDGKKGGGGAVNTFYYGGSGRIQRLPMSSVLGEGKWAQLSSCTINTNSYIPLACQVYGYEIFYLMCGTTSTNMNQSIIAYNVKTNTWRSVASRTNTMTAWQNRSGFGYNGKLYISSGYATYDINNQASINNASPSPSYFQYYDIAQETWGANNINKASQSSSQVNYGATNNKVYYIGGEHYTAGTYQSSYWQARRIFGFNRMYSVNLLTGETGIDNAYIPIGDTYHLGSGIMVPMGNILYYMYGHCATSSYYESGNAVWTDRIAMYAYDTTASIWTAKPNPPSNYNYNAVYWTLGTKIYVLHTASRALNIFDTAADTWSLGVAPPSVIASIASFAAKQMPTIGNKAYYFSGSTDNKMFVFDAEVNEGVLLASLNEGNSITSDGTIYLDDGQGMTEYNGGPWFHAEEKDYKVFALGGMPVNGIIISSDQIPESNG